MQLWKVKRIPAERGCLQKLLETASGMSRAFQRLQKPVKIWFRQRPKVTQLLQHVLHENQTVGLLARLTKVAGDLPVK